MKRLLGLILTLTFMQSSLTMATTVEEMYEQGLYTKQTKYKCHNWATYGGYNIGVWKFDEKEMLEKFHTHSVPQAGGDRIELPHNRRSENQSDWKEDRDSLISSCKVYTDNAIETLRMPSLRWAVPSWVITQEHFNRIVDYFKAERRKCKSYFRKRYNEISNSFCSDGDRLAIDISAKEGVVYEDDPGVVYEEGDLQSTPTADCDCGSDDEVNGLQSPLNFVRTVCYDWATYGSYKIGDFGGLGDFSGIGKFYKSDSNIVGSHKKITNRIDWREEYDKLNPTCNIFRDASRRATNAKASEFLMREFTNCNRYFANRHHDFRGVGWENKFCADIGGS